MEVRGGWRRGGERGLNAGTVEISRVWDVRARGVGVKRRQWEGM